jgi:outer membrane protein assembly factor BamD (BamD/ComL family)
MEIKGWNGGHMKKILLVLATVLVLALSSCSGKKAEEMYETAQFEELQTNYAHARQLYQEIIRKYPDSEYAARAADRLNALQDRQ